MLHTTNKTSVVKKGIENIVNKTDMSHDDSTQSTTKRITIHIDTQ